MQCPANVKQRMSPDITCLSYSPTNGSSTETGSAPSTNASSANLNTIAEVPPGLYQFTVGSNGEVKILCKICQYMSNKKSNFKRHFTNMHFVQTEDSSKMLECCGIRFTTKGEKFQHTKSVHKSGYKCTICSKIFDRPALLQRHLAKHTGKKPYKCSLCAYQTPNKANAKRHIEKKHSDVQEGSILFVTDDGEQIQMEVVSKGVRELEQRSFLASSLPSSTESEVSTVNRFNSDSTSFGCFAESSLHANNIRLPRSRSASATSSSLSPPGHFLVEPLKSQDKKRKIAHSIDAIMKEHSNRHFNISNLCPSSTCTTTTCCTPEKLSEGNSSSVSSPENEELAKYQHQPNYHHPSINELHMGSYCSSNWLHSSSLFPINNGYPTRNAHQVGFPQSNTYPFPSADIRNQGSSSSSSFVFRQCVHGCWHHVDNQVASDFSSSFRKDAESSFIPTRLFPHQSPDLRSSSSSVSQQTENSSINSLKSEDENDSDIIDVVGDDDEGDDDSSSKLQLLSSLCEGLGSFSTAEIPSPVVVEDGRAGECKIGHFNSPPVESAASQRSSFSSSSSNEEEQLSAERYVPKKLRVARGHYKNSN